MKYITYTREKYLALQRAYAAALETKRESLVFEGDEYDVNYVKYLIEYLKGKFDAAN